MALNRFKTDRRLWFWISLVLFGIPWFVPTLIGKSEVAPIVYLFTDLDEAGIGAALMSLATFSFWWGIPAVLVGWVLQSIIVVVSAWRKQRA